MAEAGLEVHRLGNNLWAEIGDAPRLRLLLNSHLDTVPPGEGWTSDPWTPRREADRLVGLGANDAKGCVTALIEAVLAMHRRMQQGERLGGTIVLALTAGEETTNEGMAEILDHLRPLDAAIVGEPTGLTPMIAQRGLLILKGIAPRASAHPGNTPPQLAENAVVVAAADVLRLQEFDWGPSHPQLGRAHGNVTIIHGGIAHNVIPEACEYCLDIRTTPLEPHAALFARLQAFVRSDLAVRSERLVPIETSQDAAIVQATCAATGKKPEGSAHHERHGFSGWYPGRQDRPRPKCPLHTRDEFILNAELLDGAAKYGGIIQSYFAAAAREGLS